MITAARIHQLVEALRAAGYGDDITWSESVQPPTEPGPFAREIIYVICNSGMRFKAGRAIFEKCMGAIERGESVRTVFAHPGKAKAIDTIWKHREQLFEIYLRADDKLAIFADLPWIGQITKYHVAKNFGLDVAKPDIHLQRLADAEGTTPEALCARLAAETGYRVATVDIILWRACAIGLIKSRALSPDSKRRRADPVCE